MHSAQPSAAAATMANIAQKQHETAVQPSYRITFAYLLDCQPILNRRKKTKKARRADNPSKDVAFLLSVRFFQACITCFWHESDKYRQPAASFRAISNFLKEPNEY